METKNKVLRIALIGPESTGKSTLSEGLANHYKTIWIKEYAREYLKNFKKKYTINDVLKIAKHQLKNEKKQIQSANKLIFIDTELIISKVWCEDVFKKCPQWIEKNILPHKYDFYLLTFPDIEWKADPLRENPHRRIFFYRWYKKELIAINANYKVVKGNDNKRLQIAIKIVDKFIAKEKK